MLGTAGPSRADPDPFPWADHFTGSHKPPSFYEGEAVCKTRAPNDMIDNNSPDWLCVTRAHPLKRKWEAGTPVIRMEGDKIAEYFASIKDAMTFEDCGFYAMQTLIKRGVKYRWATEREATQWQR